MFYFDRQKYLARKKDWGPLPENHPIEEELKINQMERVEEN